MENLVNDGRFTALLDAAVDGIFVIDSRGIVQVANKAVEQLLGYSQDELIGQNIKLVMPSPYRENHDAYISEYLHTGKKKIIGIGREVQAQHKNGDIIDIFLSVGTFGSAETIRFVGIVRDLRDLKRREAELATAQHEIHNLVNRLAHASRVGVMGEMAASIAHEVNQPLTAISNYAQAGTRLLNADSDQTEEVLSALSKISNQAIRAGEIIRGLRSWVRDQDDDREPCNCNALITEVVEIAKMEAQNHDVLLQLSLDPELPAVIGDPVQIQQVALNLIKNAIDAMSEGERSSKNWSVFISTERQGKERIKVTISDHGPGVGDDVADKLFQPFFTTKKAGMGMGLSICRTIIRSHGGELDFTNNAEGGASFYFILPTAVEQL
ncbi:MAG: PAS domain S-box protein [Pseudomonadales bacterium]|nr:PAS domain S-box protein [Pseudomonadales bacterium]